MNKTLRITLSIVCVLLYVLISFIPTSTLTVSALNISVEGGYTTALEDLSTDENFNPENYPINEKDYSLQVIQIAESSEKELFIYVYQPCADSLELKASSINISCSLHIKENIKNYKLNFINKVGVFYKYVVNGLTVSEETTRYYEVISIFRPWNENIDEGLDITNENTIDEVVFRVAKQYTFVTGENGVSINMSETAIETIEVTNKYVGFMRYRDKNKFFFSPVYGACDSHFIAFSTDKPIEKLYEVDIYYTTQKRSWTMSGVVNKETYGELEDKYAYLNYKQYGHYKGDGLFSYSYDWKVIQSMEEFVASENSDRDNMFSMGIFDVGTINRLTDEGYEDLKSQQWVVRFAETEYVNSEFWDGTYNTIIESNTIVGDVTILRLAFETKGVYYDLPVIDNKQTGDGIPDNIQKPSLQANDMFKILLILILIIILIYVLGPIIPTVISIVLWVVKTVFKIIYWVISLPFKLFSKNKKRY